MSPPLSRLGKGPPPAGTPSARPKNASGSPRAGTPPPETKNASGPPPAGIPLPETTDAIKLLKQLLLQGSFFALDDDKGLALVAKAFKPELIRLKRAPAKSGKGPKTSPSLLLFNGKYDEVNRTLVSVLALKWIWNNDYEAFTSSQNKSRKLTPNTFSRLHELFRDNLKQPGDLFSLLTATIINDLGKDPMLDKEVCESTDQAVAAINHDMVIYKAAKANLILCLHRLNPTQKEELILGLKLGSTLNGGQLAQAENVPGSLQGLLEMKGEKHEHAFHLKFFELILDVAGANGHLDASCAKMMTEAVAQAYLITYEVALDITKDGCSLREGYDKVLTRRAEMLVKEGFECLSVHKPEERALLRMLLMGRTADKEQAELFSKAFHGLTLSTRQRLVNGLNVDGYNDGMAILPYYMPAVFEAALQIEFESTSTKIKAIGSLMRFLTRVLHDTKSIPNTEGIVVELDVLFAVKIVEGEKFKNDPKVLDREKIPRIPENQQDPGTKPTSSPAPQRTSSPGPQGTSFPGTNRTSSPGKKPKSSLPKK